LYRVLALKALRMPLKDIAAGAGADLDPHALITRQVCLVREQLQAQQALLARLEDVQARLQGSSAVTTESLLQAIEVTTMFEKHYTDQQREQLKARAATMGSEIDAAQRRWPALMSELGALFDAGTPPADPKVRELANEWQALVRQFTGGDPGITASLTRMYQQEPQAQQQFGVRPELFGYVKAAVAVD
jgi:MerR family transcriptional regulator, thiopeptide resistance regulator